jgi:hypothetical protein
MADTVSLSALFKDLYPGGGNRIKQWVVESRRERAWENETCPRVATEPHLDNTGLDCRESVGPALWFHLDGHDCCHTCNDLAEEARTRQDIAAWLALKAERPPIISDRTALSDEIELEDPA